MHHIWAWIMHATGADNVSGPEYGFWSGFAGDMAILAAVLAFPWVQWRRHNCAMKGCWRIGRHPFTDPDDHVIRILCWKHHPRVEHKHLTRERMHLYLGRNPGHG